MVVSIEPNIVIMFEIFANEVEPSAPIPKISVDVVGPSAPPKDLVDVVGPSAPPP